MKKWIALALAALLAATAAGCAKEGHSPESLTPPDASSGVQVHWDALTDYEAPANQYTRRWADFTDHLIPADDYGDLIAFPGKSVYTEWMGSVWLYGLVTTQGEIVVDPVYSAAYQLNQYDYERQEVLYQPYLLLQKARPGAVDEDLCLDIAVAALDGSWVREGYVRYFGLTDDLLVLGTEEDRLEVLDGAGAVLWSKSAAELGVPEEAVRYADAVRIESGMLYYWGTDGIYILDLASAALTVLDRASFEYFYGVVNGVSVAQQTRGSTAYYGYVDKNGAWAIEPQYLGAEPFRTGRAIVTLPDGTPAVINTQGEILLQCERGQLFCSRGRDGSLCYLNVEPTEDVQLGEYRTYAQYEILAVYDGAFQPLNRPAVGERIIWRYDGSYCMLNGNRVTIGSGTAQTVIELPKGMIYAESNLTDSGIFLEMERESDGAYLYGCYDAISGKTVIEPGSYLYLTECRDLWGGEAYLVGYKDGGGYDIMGVMGKCTFSTAGDVFPQMTGGLMLVQDLWGVGLRTFSGDWVFRYLIMDAEV